MKLHPPYPGGAVAKTKKPFKCEVKEVGALTPVVKVLLPRRAADMSYFQVTYTFSKMAKLANPAI